MAAMLVFSASLELDETLHQIVTAARGLVDARLGTLSVFDDNGTVTQFVVAGTGEPAPPEDGAVTRDFLDVPLLARGAVVGRLHLAGKNTGRGFTADDERAVVALAAAAGIAVDNAVLYEQTRRRQRLVEATGQIFAELLGGTGVTEVLRLIASRAAELTDAENALIALPEYLDEPGTGDGELVVTVCAGPDADALTGGRIPVATSISGAVLHDHVPRSVPSLVFDLPGDLGPALAVLLRSGESTAGVLLAIRGPGGAAFGEHELQIVSAFADQAALALRDAESQSARRDLDVVTDRDRIARDLHDHVIQRLFAVGLAMQATRREAGSSTVTDRLAQHVRQLQEVIEEIRGAIFDLHPEPGGTTTLRTKLRDAVTQATGDAGIRTTVHLSGPLETVPPELAEHAEAVVREAVSNVVRHARATDLTVAITVADDLTVEVSDTGTGLPETVTRSGLRNLERRATDAHGSFHVNRRADGGTRLKWTVPLS
ncbi:GAF domain-containing protein [Amycolatopsis minnesotensis]|uniref:GAF domain-containing protein n=1 Tax=Amycolatopsis minnesotensis TaxID=337894 RepID=A0ABN2R8L7_9PSEU